MSSITVNTLFTTNTAPTITGKVTFNRSMGDTINVRFNYELYELFGGNLGLQEDPIPANAPPGTLTTGIWKLQLSDPIETGVYDVEAYVINKDGVITASDETENEVTIYIEPAAIGAPAPTLKQKMNKLNALMGAFNMLSMAAQSAFNSKGVHPVTDDDASTHLHARGKEEAAQSAEQKDYKKKKVKGVPVPVKPKNKATKDSGAPDPKVIDPDGAPGFQGEAGTELAKALNRDGAESAGSSIDEAMNAVSNAPDLAQELIKGQTTFKDSFGNFSTTPTTPLG